MPKSLAENDKASPKNSEDTWLPGYEIGKLVLYCCSIIS
jgi:hypothetical protein